MNIKFLSYKYKVQVISEDNIEEVFQLCKGNPLYYRYCPPEITLEGIKSDIVAVPPGKELKDKYYVAFYECNKIVAVMDIIDGYPHNDTAYFGFFMLAKEYHGRGEGTLIIKEVCNYLKSLGFSKIELCYAHGNLQSERFWLRNDFLKNGVEKQLEGYMAIGMEKKL